MSVNFQIKKLRDPIAIKSTKWKDAATRWLATIGGQKFDYWTGSGLTDTPTYNDVLSCLLSDTDVAELTYTEFCSEFGYEINKESRHIYNACQRNAEKFAMTGIDIATERERLADY
jgi:hypothetical protein